MNNSRQSLGNISTIYANNAAEAYGHGGLAGGHRDVQSQARESRGREQARVEGVKERPRGMVGMRTRRGRAVGEEAKKETAKRSDGE